MVNILGCSAQGVQLLLAEGLGWSHSKFAVAGGFYSPLALLHCFPI